MNPELVDFQKLGQEQRYRIFEYLVKVKEIGSRDLDVTPSYMNMVKNRKRPITDKLLEKMLRYLTVEEYAELTGIRIPIEEVDASTVVKVLKAALAKPELKYLVVDLVQDALREELATAKAVRVREDHLKRFEKALSVKSPKTRENHLLYLKRALRDLDFELSADKIQDYLLELQEESPNVAQMVGKTLKLFIKTAVKDMALYHSFKTPKPSEKLSETPLSLEQVQAVAKAIEWPPAKAFYSLLAESGIRPGELFELQLSSLDLNERCLRPMMLRNTKRSYISFFGEDVKEYLEQVYLPYRESWLKQVKAGVENLLGEDVNKWQSKLFPFKQKHIRLAIYEAMDKALGWRFKLYDLRSFHASYLTLKGVPAQVIDILQGRAPPKMFKVLAQHYLAFSLQDLKKLYDQAALKALKP